jgi:hypothetical protein
MVPSPVLAPTPEAAPALQVATAPIPAPAQGLGTVPEVAPSPGDAGSEPVGQALQGGEQTPPATSVPAAQAPAGEPEPVRAAESAAFADSLLSKEPAEESTGESAGESAGRGLGRDRPRWGWPISPKRRPRRPRPAR